MTEASLAQNPVHKSIIKAVEAAWGDDSEKSHRALLLSTLGKKLKDEFGDYSGHFPKGLKEFLRTWPLVQIVQHPEIKEKIGLIPAGAPVPKDIASVFHNAGDSYRSAYPISYNQDFWNAFSTPFQSKRYVVFKADGQIQIIDDVDGPLQGAYEIQKNDIPAFDRSTPITEKVEATRKCIDIWLAKNSLNASIVLRKPAAKGTAHQDRLSSLRHAFEKLSDGDRARILIPLDIIFKIIS